MAGQVKKFLLPRLEPSQRLKEQYVTFTANKYVIGGIWAIVIVVAVILLRLYYPIGVDWYYTFSRLPGVWSNPFVLPSFTNPPWLVALLPHALLPLEWSNAINLCLNIGVLFGIIWKYKGGWQAALLVFTSPFMFDLGRTNNVDWIPLLAFLLPPQIGLILLATKPQVLGGAGLIWLKQRGFKILVPLVVLVLISFAIWGIWFLKFQLNKDAGLWNFAPFPFMLPLGAYILYRAWQKSDEIMAAAATPFLTPYFAPYSLTGLIALLACKYRKEAFFVYIGFWIYTIVENRRLPIILSFIG